LTSPQKEPTRSQFREPLNSDFPLQEGTPQLTLGRPVSPNDSISRRGGRLLRCLISIRPMTGLVEPSAASSPIMSAVVPIATKFRAPQRTPLCAIRRPEQVQQNCPHTTYSITSSAMASRLGGNVMPRAFAVVRLMNSSNLVGWTTGRFAGLSPLRIRPTYTPACRKLSV
jgi:hypothetical protein